jgi:hypothetical protein
MNDFYVYAYLRTDDSPYYVGKGRGKRAWADHKHIKVPSDPARIILLLTGLTEARAFSMERVLIAFYGRKDLGSGILVNLTDGGEGTTGRRYAPSNAHRAALSKACGGTRKSVDHAMAISTALKGKRKSLSHRRAISKSLGRERVWFHPEHGVETCPAAELARRYQLHTGALSRVSTGKTTHHKGWRIRS